MNNIKRKFDSENKKFLIEWTKQFCFSLPEWTGAHFSMPHMQENGSFC